tara:strand:+ start:902 stop:1222 length:321 start_codon:yes stop_codon:yes gene_type:complete
MSRIQKLKPVNRHILVIPQIEKDKTQTGVLLPEDYKPDESRYVEAIVVDIASDCCKQIREIKYNNSNMKKIIVDKTMIQDITIRDRTYHMILENYVIGIFGRNDEF